MEPNQCFTNFSLMLLSIPTLLLFFLLCMNGFRHYCVTCLKGLDLEQFFFDSLILPHLKSYFRLVLEVFFYLNLTILLKPNVYFLFQVFGLHKEESVSS